MNERIRELAKQAWKEILDETSIDGDISTTFSADEVVAFEQKFAELIVRECVGLIRKQSIGEEILGGQRYKTVQLGETIATITEHFGVEE